MKPLLRHIIIKNKWEDPDYYFLYPDDDHDHSQNLGTQVRLRRTFLFFQEDPNSSNCIIMLAKRQ